MSLNAKDFALCKTSEIIQLCNDLKHTENKELRIFGIEKIENCIREFLKYTRTISEIIKGCEVNDNSKSR